MSKTMDSLLVVIMFCFYVNKICQTLSMGEEPICSKFDFEEKLLEKMVKVDHKTGLMTDSFHEHSTQVKHEIATVKADIEQLRLERCNSTADSKVQIEAQVTNIKAEIEQQWLEHRGSLLEVSNQNEAELAIIKADMEKQRLEQNNSYAELWKHIQAEMANMEEEIEQQLSEQRGISRNIQPDFEHILRVFEYMKVKLKEEIHRVDEALRRSIEDLSNAFADLKGGTRQPSYAFSASDLSASRPSSGDILVFSKTNLDNHGVYNNQTGKFTAPVSGIYTFSATINSIVGRAVQVEFLAVVWVPGRKPEKIVRTNV